MLPGLEPAELPADAIEVGRIDGAWGIKGWLRIEPYSADPEALFSCKRWYLLPAARPNSSHPEPSFAGPVRLSIREARAHSGDIVASAREIDDRDAAQALAGARVFVPRSSFPSTRPDEYYWIDLIGLDVVNREGIALGRVAELLQTGPQTVLVLTEGEGEQGASQKRMVPFVSAYVDAVDLAARRITVDWQPDY